jgi:signal transduction histidine kinase/CheY-like chemotaxis protein
MVFNRKKNGESFLSEKVITPLRDEDGRISHFICTDRDVSERLQLEAQLQQAQKMDAIGRLAGGVAHDFNNLLMVISAYAELMQDSLAAEHPLRRNIAEIMTAANRATDLTRQLLAFGRKQMQALRVLDLNSVIQEVVRMLPRIIGEDIQLVFTPGKDLGKVKADPVQIEQVVMNLAVNARDAMPRGGKLTVETANMHLDEAYIHRHSMVPAGDYVLLTVSDEGQGIAPEHVAHIFEPFYTTKREGKGTGLGLATVYGIVKQSRGFVWVYSELGLGTTFKVYLPRVRHANHHKSAPSPAMEERPQGWGTLLLVEDEAAVRKSEREFLELSGYTVLEAENGEHALRTARDHKGEIHLVITDVVMPRMGGPEMARQLAADRPQIKVLFVSGYAENTVLQHGAIDMTARFLQKPFTLKSLTRKVWQILSTDNALAAASTN